MARAVVEAAGQKGLEHSEMHSRVEYIVAHGISSRIGEKKVIIGSYHLSFRMNSVRYQKGCRSGLMPFLRNIPTCIWQSIPYWRR